MALVARFLTPREMAERLGVSVHLVRSVLEGLKDVAPAGLADNTPIYDDAAFRRLRHELNRLDAAEEEEGGDA
jgi:hypothetical protein